MRLLAGLAAGLVCALVTQAHITAGARPLRGLVAEAELVLRVQVTGTQAVPARSTDGPSRARPEVRARVLAVLEGAYEAPEIRFVQHGHGVAPFEPGREYLALLVPVSGSRELDELDGPSGPRWVSIQEHDEAHPLDEESGGEALLAATRAYVAAFGTPSPEERQRQLRAAGLTLLRSGNDRLAAQAVMDLAVSPAPGWLTKAELPTATEVLDAPNTSMGVRAGLLHELERRQLLDGLPRWLDWLSDATPSRDRVTAIRAAGRDSRPPIRKRLEALVTDPDEHVAAAAAAALGRPGDATGVPPLVAALQSPSARVRQAAVRGLGRTGTPQAAAALEQAGEQHPDRSTRRLARAEAAKLRAASR